MEVDHHKGLCPHCLHFDQTEKEEKGVGIDVSGMAEAELVEMVEGEADTFSVTLWKYIIISDYFFFYHLSKKYLYSAPVPLPLFALVLVPVSSKHPCRKRSQKQS